MGSVRLTSGFALHPDIVVLSDAAFRLHVIALCYSARYDTNGKAHVSIFTPVQDFSELVEAGMWSWEGDYIQIVNWAGLVAEGEPRRSFLPGSVRKRVRARDGDRCGICLEPIADGNTAHIDHIVPVSRGGSNELSNLRLTHATCNLRKGARLDA